ncbi:pantetheine-phosphate adenylyltransferase [Thiotrichales bacterium 19S11-10]|nr:pantetheine-phosphate adenylyltransferase [Thiotrichales bacterium 19S11-10]MCF6807962.1 pantetheine-phosphate adenylyltransferase [Thiotrichales bacterium 19S9-11]MCF6811977.1 pantetheine-phosphate adenylyltransferase [Thiotrichales bacterium 19S9-12]
MRRVVYPGTFDPLTFGHLDLIERALHLFDEVVVAISTGSEKAPLFSIDERVAMTKEALSKYDKVLVRSFDGLLVDFFEEASANAVLRGLRAVSDFEYEFQMAAINRKLNANVETIFLTPAEKYTSISSTMVREVAKIDPYRIASLVPEVIVNALKAKLEIKNS